ncbi:hydroxymethylglutaryl-CoA lyase [Robertmurraya kyonggiensis]|uniref:Hydroxymethylglutaryl-CoA lyase n=1 Tax=Robertmurraya kyonggiensis TaxID=1037680 RepID=A0A4U1DA55_9BACI|nr:hydroxymethylglutaryl-CoA lyase [Robertmurraya kyonggiensis]TKC19455.1 hydroxymethylglutaryl-CoA lyase [Robertmurraya kyonggiensis]
MSLPNSVTINDVVLRDGLQLEAKLLTVEEKLDLSNRLLEANVKTIEFGSFVHPRLVPQMANSKELFKYLKGNHDTTFIALIPNLKGAEIAAEIQVKQVNFVLSVSNTHNQQNVRQTTEESLQSLAKIKTYCDQSEIKVDVSLATTFGCPFEGKIPVERVHSIVEQLTKLSVHTITLADTTGMANPKQVYELVHSLVEKFSKQHFNLHFHNTRGMGLSNVLAGIQAGVTSFDTSLGGLGGCPFAPGATGNVCTEDVVHMLHCMEIDTGIDLIKLIEASNFLQTLVDHEVASSVLKAGKSDRKYEIPVS